MSEKVLCCPCDELVHPPKPSIAAGLPALPRQLAGFPEYRLAMLREIPTHRALEDWRAREGDDRGVMLLEMWAYVLDVLGFYDERIANETFLRTALLRPSLRRLVELIGYRPRPGLASFVVLAAIAEDPLPLLVPAGTAFRSGAFDGEPPQVFESSRDTTIDPKRNRWTLAPVREPVPGPELLLEPASAGLSPQQLALFQWDADVGVTSTRTGHASIDLRTGGAGRGAPLVAPRVGKVETLQSVQVAAAIGSASPHSRPVEFGVIGSTAPPALPLSKMVAGRVRAVSTVTGRDGESYRRLDMEPPPLLDADSDLSEIRVLTPGLSAAQNLFAGATAVRLQYLATRDLAARRQPLGTGIILDGVYSQLVPGSPVIVERAGELRPAQVVNALPQTVTPTGTTAVVPATEVVLQPWLPDDWNSGLVVHFNMAEAGRLTRVAATHLLRDDVDGAALVPPVEVPETSGSGELLLHDAEEHGVRAGGAVVIDPADPLGAGRVTLDDDVEEFLSPLRTPVAVLGNLVEATRGESVFDEITGSGDASREFQSFSLAKKSLTYIADAAAPDGRRSTLEVRVNGILWREVSSFFGVAPEDEVYIVRQDDDEKSIVTFGDGKTGVRLPTGVDNVVVRYRHGVGEAAPPANSIKQLARPVKDLRRVLNPVAAGGGRDADRSEDIRDNAPTSALTLGRAVSLIDFEALAYDFGVVNARADWAWDEKCQRAVVKLWYIGDGGDIADELRNYLIGQADPNTPLQVCEATPVATSLIIDLQTDPRYTTGVVEADVIAALNDESGGVLALENIEIGGALFRSRIFEQVLATDGATSVRSMSLDGKPAPVAIRVPEGHYRLFLPGLMVGSTGAEV